MAIPMISALIEVVRTAAAATSLAFLADGCSSEVKESTISSTAVFKNSTESTAEIVRRIINHS